LDHFVLENVDYGRRRYAPTPEFAICTILYYLAYPSRLHEAQLLFGRSATYISVTLKLNLTYLEARYKRVLDWHPSLTYERMESYARRLENVSKHATQIWGFLDGTFREICRPIRDQELFYSGYYRAHGIKYQGIVTPDGLILSLYGPFPGSVHDIFMYRECGIPEKLREIMAEQQQLFLYGDIAYTSCFRVITPFKATHPLTREERRFNKVLSSDRIGVENAFGKVVTQFAMTQFRPNQRALLQPVSLHYRISVLLANIHTIFYGNAITSRYGIKPLSLEDYLIPGRLLHLL
jgi:hypothetical protein